MAERRMAEDRGGAAQARPPFGVRDPARVQFPDRRPSPARGWAFYGACALTLALLSGASVVAKVGGGGADPARSVEATIAEREARLAELDAERKRREDGLAEIQRRANAKESELAETTERVAALEQERESLKRQVAELAGPVSPTEGDATVADAGEPVEQIGMDQPAPAAANGTAQSSTEPSAAPDRAPLPPVAPAREASTEPVAPLPPVRGELAANDEPRPALMRTAAQADRTGDDAAVMADEGARTPGVRVFIHVRSSDAAARDRARAVAAELRRRGVSVAQIRGVRLPVRRDSVRYFYDADRRAVSALQQAVQEASEAGDAPVAQDYRSYGSPPKPGTIELWLS
jgi:hypothetical protein